MNSPKVVCDIISLNCDTSEDDVPMDSFVHKSVAHRSLEYLLSLDLDSICGRLLLDSERVCLRRVVSLCEIIPASVRILATLLVRKWPRWHAIELPTDLDRIALDALITSGLVLDVRLVNIVGSNIIHPNLDGDSDLLKDVDVFEEKEMLDVLLQSLPVSSLLNLTTGSSGSMSRKALEHRIKEEYNGTQGTLFGGAKDVGKLVNRISGEGFVFLSDQVRKLFITVSYMLDVDSEDELCWNNALPSSLTSSFAKVPGSLDVALLTARKKAFRYTDIENCIYTSRHDLELKRVLGYLRYRVEKGTIDFAKIVKNALFFLISFPSIFPPDSPAWWIRRQLPRRCSDLIWACIPPLEKAKQHTLVVETLSFLLENSDNFLGKKRLGKVAIRLLIGLKHLKSDRIAVTLDEILKLDLFPADRAELERRKLSGATKNHYEWPCGPVVERSMLIAGAKVREFNWVEAAAIKEYLPLGYEEGTHCEGRVMMEIFNEFFYNLLYLPLQCPELVQSPIQKWAFDMPHADVVEARLSELGNFQNSNNTSMSDVAKKILECTPLSVLAGIMRLIVSEPYYWSGGQPDLILWNTQTRAVLFSEVKGPGDHLSPRQRYWLTELTKIGAQAEVCFVKDLPEEVCIVLE